MASANSTTVSSPSPSAQAVTAGAVRSTCSGSAVTCSPPTRIGTLGTRACTSASTRFAYSQSCENMHVRPIRSVSAGTAAAISAAVRPTVFRLVPGMSAARLGASP